MEGLFRSESAVVEMSMIPILTSPRNRRTMEEKFQLNLPEYPGFDQIVELPPNKDGKL